MSAPKQPPEEDKHRAFTERLAAEDVGADRIEELWQQLNHEWPLEALESEAIQIMFRDNVRAARENGEKKTPRPFDPFTGEISRPGISREFLHQHDVRHVDEIEADSLVGYKAPGLIIPYPGLFTRELVINGKQFCRLRLDNPTPRAKYISPPGSGCQVYVPQGAPFTVILVICEGEFKALALCECGIRAVGIGGINSALPGGQLHPDLQKILKRYKPNTIYYLGDSDTCFIYAFSREAAKLAKVLPGDCHLLLPRIPLNYPNGIDDCRESLGTEFRSFWENIVKNAVPVSRQDTPQTVARILVVRELPQIAVAANKDHLIDRLVTLSSQLDPINLDILAKEAKKILGLANSAFRSSAKQRAQERRDEQKQNRTNPGPQTQSKANNLHEQIVLKCGYPYSVTAKGLLIINQLYFIERFAAENKVIFERDEARFYLCNKPTSLWERTQPDHIKILVKEDWIRLASEWGEPRLYDKATDGLLNAIVNGVRAHVGIKGLFKRMEIKEKGQAVLHVKNGMLTIYPNSEFELAPASPGHYSRNMFNFVYRPETQCPKFCAALKHALSPEDRSLFLRWAGGCLIQGNPSQKLALMIGKADTAKSMLATVIENVVGLANIATLRTHLLHERFETARFCGKVLLTAKDVAGDFLQHRGAQVMKSLCGTDRQAGEAKGSMEEITVTGDYHIGVTSNEKLLVRLRGQTDADAWGRRILLFKFEHPVAKIIPDYHKILLAEEGEGIFALLVSGACRYLKDLQVHGRIFMTDAQKKSVNDLIYESQALEIFVSERIKEAENSDLSSEEIVEAYALFCKSHNWTSLSLKTVERRLVDLMLERFNAHKHSRVIRNGKRVNGYSNVTLKHGPQL